MLETVIERLRKIELWTILLMLVCFGLMFFTLDVNYRLIKLEAAFRAAAIEIEH